MHVKPSETMSSSVSTILLLLLWTSTSLQHHLYGEISGIHFAQCDGSHLFSLAWATVTFDHALRGNVPPSVNYAADPLREHARTLRVFAERLESKISEGPLSQELEKAVFRDREP